MSIPFNQNLLCANYRSNPNWYRDISHPEIEYPNQTKRAIDNLFAQAVTQPVVRTVQFLRDSARLVLKVPIRAIWTPVVLPKNWAERERAAINAKLTGYSFIQLSSVPIKVFAASAALAAAKFSPEGSKYLLDMSEYWITHLDGCASQLEAIKEEGCKQIKDRVEFEAYKAWVQGIDPRICRRQQNTSH